MNKIIIELTENQVGWIISTIEFDESNGNQDESIKGFRKRLLTTLIRAKNSIKS